MNARQKAKKYKRQVQTMEEALKFLQETHIAPPVRISHTDLRRFPLYYRIQNDPLLSNPERRETIQELTDREAERRLAEKIVEIMHSEGIIKKLDIGPATEYRVTFYIE